MLITLSKWIIIAFGLFIIGCGLLMLLLPDTARRIIGKAGSTNFINYAEITLRLLPAATLIIYADYSKYPLALKAWGWIMAITSFVLYFVPRSIHHGYARWCVKKFTPMHIRLFAPFAFLVGTILIYSVAW